MRSLSSSRGYARSRAAQSAPGRAARAAAIWYIQNAVIRSEYLSALPTDAASRRSVPAIRASASSTEALSHRYTQATRRGSVGWKRAAGTSPRARARASYTWVMLLRYRSIRFRSILRRPTRARPLVVARRRVIEARDAQPCLVHQLRDARQLLELDLRHLVGVRVVVGVQP